ncbi:hypothetical protein [Streptomyces sp. NPDC057690]|uniref:hypothetical protein n=1 Tax=Streptomyces sp. NPDC057690 TaxID=3346214 RepID=UPI003676E522
MNVHEGVLGGHVHGTSLVPGAARLVHAVEGVVDVEPYLTGESAPPGEPSPHGS